MNKSIALLASSVLVTISAHADVVVPVDSVEEHVNVRMEADAKSEIVGRLRQGDSLRYERTVAGWHEVLLVDDAYGYVHGEWGVVITDDAFAELQANSDAEKSADTKAQEEVATATMPGDEAPSTPAVALDTEDRQSPPAEARVADEATAETAEAVVSTDAALEAIEESVEEGGETGGATETTEMAVAADAAVVAVEGDPAVDGRDEAIGPSEAIPVPALVTTVVGPPGPPGPQGPPGLASKVNIEGTADHLVKFTKSTIGGNSQVFDDGNNVGIGTTEPKQRLEVNGNIQIHERNSSVAALMLTQSSGDTGYIMHNRANTLTIGAGSVDRMTIDRDGNVGVGVAKPVHPIQMASGAYVSAGGVWTNSSSRKLKQDIVELQPGEAVAALQELQPVRFRYRRDEGEEYVGFIAEDVPDLVASSDRESLSAMDVVAVLTKVVQQQQQQIDDLERQLRALAE